MLLLYGYLQPPEHGDSHFLQAAEATRLGSQLPYGLDELEGQRDVLLLRAIPAGMYCILSMEWKSGLLPDQSIIWKLCLTRKTFVCLEVRQGAPPWRKC